jgi:hypothetical protein
MSVFGASIVLEKMDIVGGDWRQQRYAEVPIGAKGAAHTSNIARTSPAGYRTVSIWFRSPRANAVIPRVTVDSLARLGTPKRTKCSGARTWINRVNRW